MSAGDDKYWSSRWEINFSGHSTESSTNGADGQNSSIVDKAAIQKGESIEKFHSLNKYSVTTLSIADPAEVFDLVSYFFSAHAKARTINILVHLPCWHVWQCSWCTECKIDYPQDTPCCLCRWMRQKNGTEEQLKSLSAGSNIHWWRASPTLLRAPQPQWDVHAGKEYWATVRSSSLIWFTNSSIIRPIVCSIIW